MSCFTDENSSLSASESVELTNMDSDNESTLTLDQTASQQTNSWPRKKIKGRKEKEVEFFRDLSAIFCGILYQRRMLAVWQKRFCKVKDHCLICYRLVASGVIWEVFGSNIWKAFSQKSTILDYWQSSEYASELENLSQNFHFTGSLTSSHQRCSIKKVFLKISMPESLF